MQLAVFAAVAAAIVLFQFPVADSASRGVAALSLEEFTAHLDDRIPRLMQADSITGVSTLLVHDGRLVWRRSYGYADSEDRRPLTERAILMTHSISKSLTAWGVMKLVQEGVVGLDDPASLHLPPAHDGLLALLPPEVTVRRLLSHSAGLPLGAFGRHYEPGDPLPSLAEVLTVDEIVPVHEPGSSFAYSNSGYALLELLIEHVTGLEFAHFMQQQVLQPLGMQDSSFAWSESMRERVPNGYDLRGNPVPVYVIPNRAGGGLFATLEDVGRFAAAGMRSTAVRAESAVLAAATVDELYTPQIPISGIFRLVADAYGLGHFLETLPGGATAAWHGGQGLGWMTHFHTVPERGEGIVILTNDQRSWPLIAAILADWGRWTGEGPFGMERITWAVAAVRALIGLMLLVALWRAAQVAFGVMTGARGLSLSARGSAVPRLTELALGLSMLGALLWAATRDYLYITSVAPSGSVWLAAAMTVLAAVLLISASLPAYGRTGRRSGAERAVTPAPRSGRPRSRP